MRVQREALDEMLGNLLDNACKRGRSHVTTDASQTGAGVEITVDVTGAAGGEDAGSRPAAGGEGG